MTNEESLTIRELEVEDQHGNFLTVEVEAWVENDEIKMEVIG